MLKKTPTQPKQKLTQDSEEKKMFKMFVGGLGYKVDNKSLKSHFEQFAGVKKALVIRDNSTLQSKGYGFVIFSSEESFLKALNSTIIIEGVKADCHQVLTKSNLKDKTILEVTHKIFVGGISQSTNKEVLQAYFCKFGELQEVRILYDGNTSKSRGFAFVLFKNREALEEVLSIPQHKIKGKIVEIKEFFPGV